MSLHPEVKWAQREDKVYITVVLPDAKDTKVNLDPEGVFTFSATAGADNKPYELKLDLHDKVNLEESKINIGVRNIFCVFEKAEKKWWDKLLRGHEKTPHYLKVDWDKWVDADEDGASSGPADLDMGGMDFSKFGDMGGLGGMGGMGGMGGLGGMGGMGGMGGLGGMGGMGGLGGMGGMGGLGGMGGMGGMGGLGGMGDLGAMGGLGGMGDLGGDAMGDDFEDSDDEGQEVGKPAEKADDKVGEAPEGKTGSASS